MNFYDVIIIGAGASGLMCAIEAGKRGKKVLILEHNQRAGAKILISGGGRCNFTNQNVDATNFVSNNSHFCKSAIKRFSQYDFLRLIEKNSIEYEERLHGQLFCKTAAVEIIGLLVGECRKFNVEIKTKCSIESIAKNNLFSIVTKDSEYECESLVIATGGLSIPKMGATSLGFDIAKQFNINVITCEPALVPLTLSKPDLQKLGSLSGISIDAIVSCGHQSFQENVLFTHGGLSGPAILQISNYWSNGQEIEINLLPNCNIAEKIKDWKRESPKAELKNLISTLLPKRLAHQFLEGYFINKPVNQYNDKEIKQLSTLFHNWIIIPSGTEGFDKAEVTRGGIDTDQLSSKTFESKKVKGLYFIGEVIDVTGWLGGYNFQWAWSSGWCAGQYV